jgi:tetratricopeptide (TPR) repeat protein
VARKFLDMPGAQARDAIRRRALFTFAHLGSFLLWTREVKAAAEESLAIALEIEDTRGVAQSLLPLATVALDVGDFPAAEKYAGEGLPLARNLQLHRLAAGFVLILAELANARGDLVAAESYYREALSMHQQTKATQDRIVVLLDLAMLRARRGDLREACKLADEALGITQDSPLGSAFTSFPFAVCAGLLAAGQDWPHAALLFGAAERGREIDGMALERTDAAFLDPMLDCTRRALGPDEYATTLGEGRRRKTGELLGSLRTWLDALK